MKDRNHYIHCIEALDDKTAVHILNTIAQSRMRDGNYATDATREMSDALQNAFEIDPSSEAAAEGDLARQALLVLSEIPEFQGPLSAMVDNPRPASFSLDPIVATAVLTAALVVLQTHVKIERDKKGKLSVLIEKKPTKDKLLNPLVQKILSLIPSGPYDGA